MILKFLYFTIAIICSFTDVESFVVDPSLDQQEILTQLLAKIHAQRFGFDLSKANENDCFDAYIAKQAENTKNYREEYNRCKEVAADARNELSEQSSQEREEIIRRGRNICVDLSNCEIYTDGLEFFKCYNQASSSNYPALYQISVDSNAEYKSLKVGYELIENDENNCTTLALVDYVEKHYEASNELQECLNSPDVTTVSTTTGSSSESTQSTESSSESTQSTESSSESTQSTESSSEPTQSTESSSESTQSTGSSSESTQSTESSSESTTTEPPPEEDLDIGSFFQSFWKKNRV